MQDSFLIPCALENRNFSFELFSKVAEQESWRKDINRPIYHIHKWWAQRLGSVFRAIILGALSPSNTDLYAEFYRQHDLSKYTIFDPFMGSGTTIGEAAKLKVKSIGKDINPVAYFLVKNALSIHNKEAVVNEFKSIENDVSDEIKKYYKARLPNGQQTDVLYYFWVKTVECPTCGHDVELFSTRIFARHAYPKRHPKAQSVCPKCGGINQVCYDDSHTTCSSCNTDFSPQAGSAKGQNAICFHCNNTFKIAQAIRLKPHPPKHHLYAKLLLSPKGEKIYSSIDKYDIMLYEEASKKLRTYKNAYPVVPITSGYNTDQILGYNYNYWHEMFNDRQLLSLAILSQRIQKISDEYIRDIFVCLFSGILEFNNMFVSYKGEGTGAVRHMFAHHILKPERVPLEANPWGTPKSSGSFLTMFKGRICKALDYAENPFELVISEEKKATNKIYGISPPLGFDIAKNYFDFIEKRNVYLSCGDSSKTDIPDASIDAIITDPPFFDNVHYSQLADFFYIWQKHILHASSDDNQVITTRSADEVQNSDADQFAERLTSVFKESHRILKDTGILAFTYHHSRDEGWQAILKAIMNSGFTITAAQPIKSEMSVAMPKTLAKEPIDIDIILACRKRIAIQHINNADCIKNLEAIASDQIKRFFISGRKLSKNDIKVIVISNFISLLSQNFDTSAAISELKSHTNIIETMTNSLHSLYIKARD